MNFKKSMQFHSNAALCFCWWTNRSVHCVCIHSNIGALLIFDLNASCFFQMGCFFATFDLNCAWITLNWIHISKKWSYSFIYLFLFIIWTTKKEEKMKSEKCVCECGSIYLYKLLFKCLSIISTNVVLCGKLVIAFRNRWCTWEIGVQ